MKHWIGPWLMVTAVIHTGFAIAAFDGVLGDVVARGLYDTVGVDPVVNTAIWFLLFGVVLFISGQAITALDRTTRGELPRPLGWSLLALATIGVVLMPLSGFWLAFPPAIAVVTRRDW